MAFRWRLGLDVGTNSIGWAVLSIDEKNEPLELEDLGARVFSDGRDPKGGEPLALERRMARGMRRSLHRRKVRRKNLFRALREMGLFPADSAEAAGLKALDPYELRAAALNRRLAPFELGRALFNLGARRGFKSNRKGTDDGKSGDEKKEEDSQEERIALLENAIKESGARTLGEYLYNRKLSEEGVRFAPGRCGFYPSRQMYLDEFNAIRNAQEEFCPQCERGKIDWARIEHAIFWQRPLKRQERGKCPYTGEERAFKAMPCSQKRRILQDVANLNYTNERGETWPLSEDEQKMVASLLDKKEKAPFAAIKKALSLDERCAFNLESDARPSLLGNGTAAKMRKKACFGPLWDTLSLIEQDSIVETLITAEEDSSVEEMLKGYPSLTDEQRKNIANAKFKGGTDAYSRTFCEQVVSKMESFCVPLNVAVEMLGYKYAEQNVEACDELPYYGKALPASVVGADPNADEDLPEKKYGKIANPTVHIALNQIRVVVNALIKKYGKPAEVVVEVGRELKAEREAKETATKRISANQRRNESDNAEIRDMAGIAYPSRDDRLRLRLWKELDPDPCRRKCIYCGKPISAAELFGPNVEVDHILPFSRTLLDAEHNKTVAHAACNREKGERTPYEAFGSGPARWARILERAAALKNPKKRAKFAQNVMEEFERESSFISRQLTDNAYIARIALRYLKCVCPDTQEEAASGEVKRRVHVWCASGMMTRLLRERWGLDSLLKRKITEAEIARFNLKDEDVGNYKKNRLDHRHHAVDAVVIALCDRSMVKKVSEANKRRLTERIAMPEMPVPRRLLEEKLKGVVPSFKPDHGHQGKLSKETPLGIIKKAEAVPALEVKQEDLRSFVNKRIAAEFESAAARLGWSGACRELAAKYPVVRVFKEYYVCRENLSNIKEKNLNKIVDETIKRRIRDFVEANRGSCERFEVLMKRFSEETGIRRVRIVNRDQTPIPFSAKGFTRYLCVEDYYTAVIWRVPAGKGGKPMYKASFIRRDEADARGNIKRLDDKKPHPNAKKVCMLFKGDCIEFCCKGKFYKGRVAGYSATNGRLDIRPVYSATDCRDWIISTAEKMLDCCPLWIKKDREPQKGQNYVSVNILFGEMGARRISVDPLGRIRRSHIQRSKRKSENLEFDF